MKNPLGIIASFLSVAVLSVGLMAQPAGAARYDSAIQQKVTQELQDKKEFRGVQSSVEDGIVTLSGTVDLYQQKLDAAKKVRKTKDVQGVRNLIEVAGPSIADQQLEQKLADKLYYDAFNYFTLTVKDGVVTVGGETYNDVGRDTALGEIQRTPGVKDVVNHIKVSPTSLFDDELRVRAAQAIYRDSALGKYAIDPARPMDSAMDKQIAGMRVSSVPGAFSVKNNLVIEGQSNTGM